MITLPLPTWTVLVATLLILLFVVGVVVFIDPLEAWYLRSTVGPELERQFGFTAETLQPNPAFQDRAFVITFVEPSGVLAKAGIQAGDRPWDYHGRTETRFYQTLVYARRAQAILRVTRVDPGADVPRLVSAPVRLASKPPN